jgi:hypothetical protein
VCASQRICRPMWKRKINTINCNRILDRIENNNETGLSIVFFCSFAYSHLSIHGSMSSILFILFSFHVNTIIAVNNAQQFIEFQVNTLNKLRLRPASLSTSVSYNDFELLNDYQCAIECIKDKVTCTGYAYNAATKMCSLYDDPAHPVSMDVIKLVRSCV